jgi:hypothetical protein
MAETPNADNIEDLSPYALLQNFSINRVLPAILLAVLLHVVVIAGLSTGFIYRTWIDPTADAQEPATADGAAANDDRGKDGAAKDGAAKDADGGMSSGKSGSDGGSAAAASDGSDTPPVIQRVTDTADPGDVPEEPGGLGISIDDIKE